MAPCVAHINSLRAKHGAPPLTWGKYEARDADQWARYLHETQRFEKDPQTQHSDPEGELLTKITSEASPVDKCITAVDQWYVYREEYEFVKPVQMRLLSNCTAVQ